MKPFIGILKALFSHYWRHPWQTLFLLSGLVAGVALWSAVQVINAHAKTSYTNADSLLGSQMSYMIRAREGQVSHDTYIQLRRKGWVQLYPVIEARVQTSDGELLSVIATDLFAVPGNQSLGQMNVGGADSGWLGFIQPPFQSWYPPELAESLGIDQADEVLLNNGLSLPPAMIAQDNDQGWQVLIDIAAAEHLLGSKGYSYLGVGDLDQSQVKQLTQQLPSALVLEKNVQALDLAQLTESLHNNLTAMSLLSFAVGLFIVMNAVRFSLWHRQSTLKNLQLMGVDLKSIALALLLESLLWSVIASGLGLIVGYWISWQLLPTLSATLDGLYGATLRAEILLSFETIALAWSMTFLGLLMALFWPMWQLSLQSVLEGNRLSTQWQNDVIARSRLLHAGLALAVLAIALYPIISTVFWGFVLLGLVLFAGAWCLPAILSGVFQGVASLLKGRSKPLNSWIISDGLAQLPSIRTAMMALLLALTCNLGVESMIGSFRTAFISWLEQRLTADIYVRAEMTDLEKLLSKSGATTWLNDSHERFEVDSRWGQRPTQIRGLDINAPDTLSLPLAQAMPEAMRSWSNQPTPSSTSSETPFILANEQVHYLGKVGIGDVVHLQTENGPKAFKLAGFFYDYGNANYQFYLPQQLFEDHWPSVQQSGVAFWLNGAETDREESLIRAEAALVQAGIEPGQWLTQGRLRETAIGVFEKTFAITLAMNALTLLVAGMALLTSMMAILQERLPQFAQWSALGVSRMEQQRVIALPLLLFVGLTWLLSMPLGALLSWLLINKLNIISFGWSMPMLWSFSSAMVLALLCLVMVSVAILMVSLRLKQKLPTALAQLGGSQ